MDKLQRYDFKMIGVVENFYDPLATTYKKWHFVFLLEGQYKNHIIMSNIQRDIVHFLGNIIYSNIKHRSNNKKVKVNEMIFKS